MMMNVRRADVASTAGRTLLVKGQVGRATAISFHNSSRTELQHGAAARRSPGLRRFTHCLQQRGPAIHDAFKAWKKQHERTYASEAEEAKALKAFEDNLRLVQKSTADAVDALSK